MSLTFTTNTLIVSFREVHATHKFNMRNENALFGYWLSKQATSNCTCKTVEIELDFWREGGGVEYARRKCKSRISFVFSMLTMQQELNQLSIHKPDQRVTVSIPVAGCNNNNNESSPDTPLPPFKNKPWLSEGIFGCLKPIWNVLGKASANETKCNPGNY